MAFVQFKMQLINLAAQHLYLLPGDNNLVQYWEKGYSPSEVWQKYVAILEKSR